MLRNLEQTPGGGSVDPSTSVSLPQISRQAGADRSTCMLAPSCASSNGVVWSEGKKDPSMGETRDLEKQGGALTLVLLLESVPLFMKIWKIKHRPGRFKEYSTRTIRQSLRNSRSLRSC